MWFHLVSARHQFGRRECHVRSVDFVLSVILINPTSCQAARNCGNTDCKLWKTISLEGLESPAFDYCGRVSQGYYEANSAHANELEELKFHMFPHYVWVQYVSRIKDFNASFRQKGCEGPGLVEENRDERGVKITWDRLRTCVNFTNLEVFSFNSELSEVSNITSDMRGVSKVGKQPFLNWWPVWPFWPDLCDLCDLFDQSSNLSSRRSLRWIGCFGVSTPPSRTFNGRQCSFMRACVSSKFLKLHEIQEKRQQFLHLRHWQSGDDAKWSQQQCGVALQVVRKYCHFFPNRDIHTCTGDGSLIFTKSSC